MHDSFKEKVDGIFKGWFFPIFMALLIATSFKSAIADWYVVPTGSMKPTIVEGDRVFVNKLAYDLKVPYTTLHIAEWGALKRGEIVVFYSPADGTRLIKRVIGIPGDSIEMQNNKLILNGKTLQYEPVGGYGDAAQTLSKDFDQFIFSENINGVQHPIKIAPERQTLSSFNPITVPKGKYFMMGDNRDNSADSRYFGFVDRDLVLGRAKHIVISLDLNDKYRPRWERFFTKML